MGTSQVKPSFLELPNQAFLRKFTVIGTNISCSLRGLLWCSRSVRIVRSNNTKSFSPSDKKLLLNSACRRPKSSQSFSTTSKRSQSLASFPLKKDPNPYTANRSGLFVWIHWISIFIFFMVSPEFIFKKGTG